MTQKINQISFNNSNNYYRNFINSCKSQATKNDYRNGLRYFMNYLNIGPEDYHRLIDGRDAKIIQADIIDWIIHLKDIEKKSPATINLYTSAVKHFYEMNDITLNNRRINAFKPEFRNVVEDQPYTREQIKTLLDKTEQRNRAIILLLSSSGIRVGAISDLKIKDLTPIDKYNIYQIQVYKRSSKKSKYITFCTPECRKEIDAYLEYRKRYGERITENSPLFRLTFNREDQFKTANEVKSISTIGIKNMINELLNVSGVRTSKKMLEGQGPPQKQYNFNRHTHLMEVHGFRKFFDTTCITSAGMNSLYTEMLMGHDVGLKGRYTKLTPEELLEGNDKNLGYASAMEHLIICETDRLRIENERLIVKRSEMEEMKNEMNEMKNAYSDIMNNIYQSEDDNPIRRKWIEDGY
jgi:integrase